MTLLLISCLPGACGRSEPDADPALDVVVSIAPLRGLVEPLLPQGAELTVLIPAGRNIHDWRPTPQTSRRVAEADLIVTVGLGLEPAIDRLATRHASSGARRLSFARLVEAEGHEHGSARAQDERDHDHAHAGDAHLWLDPVLARRFVEALTPELAGLAPAAQGSAIRARGDELIARIEALHTEHRQRLEPFKGRSIVTHHAAFTRLAERYDLRIAAVIRSIEAAEPSPGRIREVVAAIEREGVGVVFLEPQFSDNAATRIAEAAGVKVGRLDPIGDGDWFAMMRSNLEELATGLESAGAGADEPDSRGD